MKIKDSLGLFWEFGLTAVVFTEEYIETKKGLRTLAGALGVYVLYEQESEQKVLIKGFLEEVKYIF